MGLLIQFAMGLVIGFATGLTGMGAAVLVVPVLIYAIGLSPVMAVGTGLLYSMLTRAYASFEHLCLLTVRKRTSLYIILGSIPSVLITSSVVAHLAGIMGNSFDFAMEIVIAIVMLITWTLMTVALIRSRSDSNSYYKPKEHFPAHRKLLGLAAGAGVGALVGSTSIGGGVFLVPILSTVFRLSPQDTVGTSTLVSVIMSATGSFAYLLSGGVDLRVALIMFAGSIPGVWFGCRLAVKTPHKVLFFLLFAVVTVSTIAMFAGMIK